MAFDPLHRVIVGALIERDGRLLINRRPPGSWGAGEWEFPGGKVEAGEDPRAALERECREELDCDVRAGEVCDVLSHAYDYGHLLLIFIRCEIVSGEPRGTEGNTLAWARRDELLGYPFLVSDLPLVRRLAAEAP